MTNNELYNMYIFARHQIQLENVVLKQVDIKNEFNDKQDFENSLSMGTQIEIINDKESYAYLKTDVEYINEESKKIEVLISIVYRGHFVSSVNLSKDELISFTEAQCVPQLLPYVRACMTNLSTMMLIPPIVLPTMDIIESLKSNRMEE